MARRTRTYVAFDADSDIDYYYLMKAWKANDNMDFDFNNAHDLTTIRDDSGEEAIKASLRERMKNSKILMLLVGENTKKLRKYVPWEIEIALKADLPIILVNLNKSKAFDPELCPAILKNELTVSVPYVQSIMQHSLDTWPADHVKFRSENKIDRYIYLKPTYDRLGL